MANRFFALLVSSSLVAGLPAALEQRNVTGAAALPPKASVQLLGNTSSTLPNIYRDGGGGGKINGLNFMWFSDGLYTKGGVPDKTDSNLLNFTSNSIACSGCDGKGPLSLTEFGTTAKGPNQQVPYFYNNGEHDLTTGVWPNQGFATLCNGACGVSFPQVVNRTAMSKAGQGSLYNTGVQISVTEFGPVVSRPTQALFNFGEPTFGTFGALPGRDGDNYLYLFASISETDKSNGLKMARVPQASWHDRTQYQYWDGKGFVAQMPKIDDGGAANVFSWSSTAMNGKAYGPGTGDVFFSEYYGVYMVLFQASDAALDARVYMSYSQNLTSGWSTPESIYQITEMPGGYSYSFHAYPNYDPTGKVIPLSWSQFADPNTFLIGMANVTFS